MALHYIGNCGWEQSGNPTKSSRAGEIPTVTDQWLGRSDLLEDFLSSFPVGASHLGGYISNHNVNEHSPGKGLGTVDIVVSLPPNVGSVQTSARHSIKPLLLTSSLNSTTVDSKFAHYYISREILAKAPVSQHKYFSSSQPGGPRYSGSASSSVKVLKDIISVDCYDTDWNWKIRYELDPSQVNSEILAKVKVKNLVEVELSCDPIPGTPWFQCVDTVTTTLQANAES